jgi:hypothetical protein
MADKTSLEALYTGGTGDPKTSLEELYSGQKKPELNLLDVPGQALGNLIPSAKRFAGGIAQTVAHPIDTLESIGRLGAGAMSKLGVRREDPENEQFADAAGKAFLDRYGGWEPLKKTIANDPVGFVADLSMAFSGAGGALRAVPGLSEGAETAATIGRTINPVNLAAKGAGKAGEIVPQVIGNLGTGTGAAPIKTAVSSGMEGNRAFLKNMRDPEGNAAALVPQARKALEAVRLERSQEYQRSMEAFGKRANQPLSFKDIHDEIDKQRKSIEFEGQDVGTLAGENEPTPARQILDKIEQNVRTWESHANPAIKTAAGLDKLKQHIGSHIDWMGKPSSANKVAQGVYAAIKDTIVKQDPTYAGIMKDYSEASDLLNELEKTLSLGKKASEDTALRKLLSTTRSGVNTNFGKRAELADILNQHQPDLVPGLAGQALAGWTPQGINRLIAGGIAGMSLKDAKDLLALPITSPRLVGETAYKLGQGAGKAKELTPQMIKDLMGKINPDVLKQILLLQQQAGRQQ